MVAILLRKVASVLDMRNSKSNIIFFFFGANTFFANIVEIKNNTVHTNCSSW
jgi:hypothetical protein